MGLNEEINQRRAEISSDGYSMSVGELISMYENGELNIRPQVQRFFRWTPYQRSRLIESLLLKIPIPSIFVSQRQDGVWDGFFGDGLMWGGILNIQKSCPFDFLTFAIRRE